MHILLHLAIWASISCVALTTESSAPAPGDHAPSDPAPLTGPAPGEEEHSRAKRGGKINYRRLARGLHMIRLGKRGEATSLEPSQTDEQEEQQQDQLQQQYQINALLHLLSTYRDELAASGTSPELVGVPFEDTDVDVDDRSIADDEEDEEGIIGDLPYITNLKHTMPSLSLSSLPEGQQSPELGEYYDAAEPSEGGMEEKSKRGLSMLRLGKRGLSMLRLGKRDGADFEKKQEEDLNDVYDVDDKRGLSMLRLGKRPMSMLRLGKRPMSMLRLGKRPMSMLRLGKRGMSMLRLGKRPMSMLRLGKRPMSMLRLGKRPMSMLRLGKRPMSMLRLGKRPMSMLRLGKRSVDNAPGH